jgi:hypothetical protein
LSNNTALANPEKKFEEYAKKHGLTIEEDKERKYLLIFKP